LLLSLSHSPLPFCLLICLFIEVVYRFWFANFSLSRFATQSLSTLAFSFFSFYFCYVTFLGTVRFTYSRRPISGLFSRLLSRSGLITLVFPSSSPFFRDLRRNISSKRQSSPAPSHFDSIDRSCVVSQLTKSGFGFCIHLRFAKSRLPLCTRRLTMIICVTLDTRARNVGMINYVVKGIVRKRWECKRVNYFPIKILLKLCLCKCET